MENGEWIKGGGRKAKIIISMKDSEVYILKPIWFLAL